MKKLFVVALDDNEAHVVLLDPETGEQVHAETIFLDLDGDDVAVTAAIDRAVRNYRTPVWISQYQAD
jgi:hypothetical protein